MKTVKPITAWAVVAPGNMLCVAPIRLTRKELLNLKIPPDYLIIKVTISPVKP